MLCIEVIIEVNVYYITYFSLKLLQNVRLRQKLQCPLDGKVTSVQEGFFLIANLISKKISKYTMSHTTLHGYIRSPDM